MKEELYKIFYKKYSIIANDYLSYVKVVKTADIYHEVGKLICTSIERIKDIWYGTMKDENAYKVSVAYWEENGYRKIDGTQTWVCEKQGSASNPEERCSDEQAKKEKADE